MKLRDVIDAIAAGRRYRETGGHAPWRKGFVDLHYIPPVFYGADTWELEPEPEVIRLSSGTAASRLTDGFRVVDHEMGEQIELTHEEIAALYAASKGEPEYVKPLIRTIHIAYGPNGPAASEHELSIFEDGYRAGHKDAWDARGRAV